MLGMCILMYSDHVHLPVFYGRSRKNGATRRARQRRPWPISVVDFRPSCNAVFGSTLIKNPGPLCPFPRHDPPSHVCSRSLMEYLAKAELARGGCRHVRDVISAAPISVRASILWVDPLACKHNKKSNLKNNNNCVCS